MKHPNIIAAAILSLGMMLSSLLLGSAIRKVATTINGKYFGSSVRIPDTITLEPRGSSFPVSLQNYSVGTDVKPIHIEQRP
jgi:hypothetical protein